MLISNGKSRIVLLVLCFALAIPALSFAVPASPNNVNELRQTDGSIVMGVLRGDELLNWVETVSGRLLLQDTLA
ncbi:MAG: hypothetical protein HQL06_16760 [Nitrospirae bacterium]|nr:hypothetical protein [Nitrospirota bacterium]